MARQTCIDLVFMGQTIDDVYNFTVVHSYKFSFIYILLSAIKHISTIVLVSTISNWLILKSKIVFL